MIFNPENHPLNFGKNGNLPFNIDFSIFQLNNNEFWTYWHNFSKLDLKINIFKVERDFMFSFKEMKNSEFSDNSQNWENVPVSGLIGLKDQGHAVWFRNIKLKPL